eukprot:776745-Amphidinium_carterae.1
MLTSLNKYQGILSCRLNCSFFSAARLVARKSAPASNAASSAFLVPARVNQTYKKASIGRITNSHCYTTP